MKKLILIGLIIIPIFYFICKYNVCLITATLGNLFDYDNQYSWFELLKMHYEQSNHR